MTLLAALRADLGSSATKTFMVLEIASNDWLIVASEKGIIAHGFNALPHSCLSHSPIKSLIFFINGLDLRHGAELSNQRCICFNPKFQVCL